MQFVTSAARLVPDQGPAAAAEADCEADRSYGRLALRDAPAMFLLGLQRGNKRMQLCFFPALQGALTRYLHTVCLPIDCSELQYTQELVAMNLKLDLLLHMWSKALQTLCSWLSQIKMAGEARIIHATCYWPRKMWGLLPAFDLCGFEDAEQTLFDCSPRVLTPDSDGSSGHGIVNIELQMGSVPLLETSNIQSKASASIVPLTHKSAAVVADSTAVATHMVAGTAGLPTDASAKALLPISPVEKKTKVLSAAAKQSPQMLLSPTGFGAAVPSINSTTSASQTAAMQASSSKIAALHAPDAAAPTSFALRSGSSDNAAGSVDSAAPTAAPKNSAELVHGDIVGFAQAAKLPIDPRISNAVKGQQANAKPRLVKTPFSKQWLWPEILKLRQVGCGGSAQVFRAYQVSKGKLATRQSAVKVMQLADSDDMALAKHEDAVLSDLDGKAYVPAYYGAQYTPGHAYLIMELVNGQTVESICKILHTKAVSMQSGPEFDRFREWVLQDLHLQRSHRDIKPANLMLSGWREGKVNLTLVDWASSRLHSQGPQPNGPFTPEYCAPRVIHHMCDPHAPPMAGPPDDVWGLAVTFHQLLTSVDLAREPTFGPYAEDGMHIVDLQTALMREHNIWASTLTKLEHPIAGEDLPPRPRFIWSVRRVADSLPAAKQQEQSNRVFHLLMQLLAPSEHRRLTAADVVQMAWLQDAASSLEPCPVKLSL